LFYIELSGFSKDHDLFTRSFGKMKLAVIPARGGSKRIPRKNIKSFCGKPIIEWSIKAAQEADVFDRIIVSTDDMEISSIARESGADTPFTRPVELSGDYIDTRRVIVHAIDWHLNHGYKPAHVCCIYATAPFIEGYDIQRGMEALEQSKACFAFSVTSFAFPIQRAIKFRSDGRVEMFDPTKLHTRSQDLPKAYHDAGQFYWGTRSAWLSDIPIFGSQSVPIVLPRHRVQDIDTPEDWEQAEIMMRALVCK
jgi:pseudaminic acid cytidylyltransferase